MLNQGLYEQAVNRTERLVTSYQWFFGFGGKAKILSPIGVIDEYGQHLMECMDCIDS